MNRLDIRNEFSIFILLLLYTFHTGRILCPDEKDELQRVLLLLNR